MRHRVTAASFMHAALYMRHVHTARSGSMHPLGIQRAGFMVGYGIERRAKGESFINVIGARSSYHMNINMKSQLLHSSSCQHRSQVLRHFLRILFSFVTHLPLNLFLRHL